jgi:transposase-like protein
MPWSETSAMDERMRFVLAASENEAVMAEVCAEFGISRQSGYKWLARYRVGRRGWFEGAQPGAAAPWTGPRRGGGGCGAGAA